MKKAFVTGITGQDGSYLAELLIEKGYEVHGLVRRSSSFNTGRIENLYNYMDPQFEKHLFLYYGDLTDSSNLSRLIEKIQPNEIYNLGAQSHVKVSFEVPEYTADTTAVGTLRLLDAIKDIGIKPKYYQASTSEMFGGFSETVPQNEKTPFYPKSPYGAAKVFAYWVTINYREAYDIFACNGILFNHESPRRGKSFVTRKISYSVANIYHGKQSKLLLGNLAAKRDWGYAKDYVEGMWLMLQQDEPDDYILATGKTYTVREFCTLAFQEVGVDLVWEGTGKDEKGINSKTGRVLVEVDSSYFRPTEVEFLCGNPTKARKKLGWESKTSIETLVSMMVKHDVETVGGTVEKRLAGKTGWLEHGELF